MLGGKGYLTVGIFLAAFLAASSGANSASGGIDRSRGLTDEGCVCHGPAGENGVPNPNVTLLFDIVKADGSAVVAYEPGATYNLMVGAATTDVEPNTEGNQGGFNLKVNIGTLAAGEGFEGFVQGTSTEMTHTSAGDRNGRDFNLTWSAPSGDEGAASFILFVNTVNGDGSNSEEDHWAGRAYVLASPSGSFGAAEGANPSAVGVNWYAHWVGLISFAAVVVTLMIYYFVLKYGESIHTTDHRDRSGKE